MRQHVALDFLEPRLVQHCLRSYAPVEYIHALRVEEAKQLLESTREPVESVAQRVGYDEVTFFRRLFKRCTGVTPARYRQRIRAILA